MGYYSTALEGVPVVSCGVEGSAGRATKKRRGWARPAESWSVPVTTHRAGTTGAVGAVGTWRRESDADRGGIERGVVRGDAQFLTVLVLTRWNVL